MGLDSGKMMKVQTTMMILAMVSTARSAPLVLDGTEQWSDALLAKQGIEVGDGLVKCTASAATFQTKVISFGSTRKMESLTLKQSDGWLNWKPVGKVLPANLGDAPVFLVKGDKDYWAFGLYGKPRKSGKSKEASREPAQLEGFDIELMTTPYENQYDAPGGLKESKGGYHAWQSRDMKRWVHHGPVTEKFSRWVTTAEMVDGKTYIYYDFPNDQDPHLYIDEDLTDGQPGENIGLAFKDPSHGSDCAVIRGLDGRFHVIYEDWSPINARAHSWDSPLAGHAVGEKGYMDFKIMDPAVDLRTKPTGKMARYDHPHWSKEDPKNFKNSIAEYEVHEPEQDAFGDWAAIAIGGQYYLFGDYHPVKGKIRIGWFTSSSIDEPFGFCGEIGAGHPDPDIGFAEGKFYLLNQTSNDFISDGPWVGGVRARVGVDCDGDGKLDEWTDWQEIGESYDHIEGFSKQIKRTPAMLDCSSLPEGKGFALDVKFKAKPGDVARPEFDKATLRFAK